MFTKNATKLTTALAAVALTFVFGTAMAFDWSDHSVLAGGNPYMYLEGTDLMDAVSADNSASGSYQTYVATESQPRNFAIGRYAEMETSMLLDAIQRGSANTAASSSVTIAPPAARYAGGYGYNPYTAQYLESAQLLDAIEADQKAWIAGTERAEGPSS